MSLHGKLDEVIAAARRLPTFVKDLNSTLRQVKRELGGVRHRLDLIERRLYDLVLQEKERKLLGPDVYPEENVPQFPFVPGPIQPQKPLVPESPHVVMYGVASLDGSYPGSYQWTKSFIDVLPKK